MMMDLGVPTRKWENYRAGHLKDEFGQDEFRNSAKRRKLGGTQTQHVEGAEEGKHAKPEIQTES
jgi:hypothetical protein